MSSARGLLTLHVGAPGLSGRREIIRELVSRRGPGVHAEYEATLRGSSDAELEAELERTADASRWIGERAEGDSDDVRVLPPMSVDHGAA